MAAKRRKSRKQSPTHISDQHISGWREFAKPLLDSILQTVEENTGDREFAVQVTCWAMSGPACLISSLEEALMHSEILTFLEQCATNEACSVYRAWVDDVGAASARDLAIAYIRSRFVMDRVKRAPDAEILRRVTADIRLLSDESRQLVRELLDG